MKTTKSIQWVLFTAMCLTLAAALGIGVALLVSSVAVWLGSGAAVLLAFALSAGSSALYVLVAVHLAVWLAERGWFV